MKDSIYEPREDSELLKRNISKYASGKKVLDMGTGSGILARETLKYTSDVTGVDVNPKVVDAIKDFKVIKSNLFSKVIGKYDLILFNPPYLPKDSFEDKEAELINCGGKQGYELIAKFLSKVSMYLEQEGKILLLFSNLTIKEKVDYFIFKYGFKFKLIDTMKLPFFEELYVYELSRMFKEFDSVELFQKGHRGYVYVSKYKGKKVAIKFAKENINTIWNEIIFLKILNEHKIGPKFLFEIKDGFVMEFIKGEKILDYFLHCNKLQKIKVIKEVLNQMFTLDTLKINKFEMNHPDKHVLIGKKIVLIDFERARRTDNPKNVSQFVQFINRHTQFKIDDLLVKEYKKDCSKELFNKILKLIK